jgi:hypothetical protein
MTQLEIVARALARASGYDPDETWEEFDRNAAASMDANGEYDGWEDDVFPKRIRWKQFEYQARIALAAIGYEND